jgi:hypothetical protein
MASYSTVSKITTPDNQTARMATHNFTTPNEKITGSPTTTSPGSLPKLDISKLSPDAQKNAKSKRSSKVAEMQQYLKQLEISHAKTRSVVESITGSTPERSKKQEP